MFMDGSREELEVGGHGKLGKLTVRDIENIWKLVDEIDQRAVLHYGRPALFWSIAHVLNNNIGQGKP